MREKCPRPAPGVRANVIEADAFKSIKHHNLRGLITLLTYIITYLPYCYRIISSVRMGGIKIKLTGSPVFFSPQGNTRLACRFASTINPFF